MKPGIASLKAITVLKTSWPAATTKVRVEKRVWCCNIFHSLLSHGGRHWPLEAFGLI